LTSPFPSATDKARVIFVYLHHHISYDFSGFLGDTPMGKQDALSVLRSGKSVCQGYAELFLALATQSGLEAALVSGDGKGYGYTPGNHIPWPPTGHAWNAVRFDAGEWWLIDACWGAGHVNKETGYTREFNEAHFISTPEEFGRRHFPKDSKWLLTSRTWEEYCTYTELPGPEVYANFDTTGFMRHKIAPAIRKIDVDGLYEVVLVKGPCECFPYEGRDEEERMLFVRVGKDEEMKVMRRDGRRWKAVVKVSAGQRVAIEYILTWEGRDGRSIDASTFEGGIGKVGWSWTTVVEWKE
jgi:transglutaminase/protease-like cytokinesis protein 3